MSRIKLLIICCCALLVIPSFAQTPNNCSRIGTWYGGSDYKYLMTITPITGEGFAVRHEAVYDNAVWGYKAWTSWSGELSRLKNGRYAGQSISLYTTSPDPQPPPSSFELDAVRFWDEFVDCNTIKLTIDFYVAYFDLNRIPFVDSPDLSYLPPGGTIVKITIACQPHAQPAAVSTRHLIVVGGTAKETWTDPVKC